MQAIHLALKQAGAAAETTLYLDDSARNVSAAHEEGIFSVLVSIIGSSEVQSVDSVHEAQMLKGVALEPASGQTLLIAECFFDL